MHRSVVCAITGFSLALALGALGCAASAPTTELLPPVAASPVEAIDWNDASIDWYGHEDGLSRIEASGKPGVLIFYTNWCPHCHNYSRVFRSREVVQLAKRFVMIRVDRDADAAVSDRYAKHGRYVPRTFFLDTAGEVDWEHKGSHPRYPYFLDEDEPGELVSLMRSFDGAPVSATEVR